MYKSRFNRVGIRLLPPDTHPRTIAQNIVFARDRVESLRNTGGTGRPTSNPRTKSDFPGAGRWQKKS